MTDSETLQTEEQSTESLEAGSESAPEESEGESPKDKDPAGFTKAINRKHFQLMEETRRADALAEENARLKADAPGEKRPDIPDIPDPYDENYGDLIAKRDQAVKSAAHYDAKQETAARDARHANEAAQAKSQERLVSSATKYSERAEKLGISEQELGVAGNVVAAYGIDDSLVMHILDDDQGPLITAYLAKNPDELETLRTLSPMQAAVRISTDIKSKATAAAGISGAPPPADTLGGGGVQTKERGPEGATYE